MMRQGKDSGSATKAVGSSDVFYLPKTSQEWKYLLVQYFSNTALIASACFDG